MANPATAQLDSSTPGTSDVLTSDAATADGWAVVNWQLDGGLPFFEYQPGSGQWYPFRLADNTITPGYAAVWVMSGATLRLTLRNAPASSGPHVSIEMP